MASETKVRENRLRRMAERQGLRLEKSRRRDPRAVDYGTYRLINPQRDAVVLAGAALGAVESELMKGGGRDELRTGR
jgi:hypothetical protein